MTKATIYVYSTSKNIEYYDVNNFHIDDNLVIAEDDVEKFIFPLSSIIMIEALKNEKR